jgi:hypothetical protein
MQTNFTEEETNRVKAASEALDAVMDNYKVALMPVITIAAGQIMSHQVAIVPQREESRIVVPTINKDKLNLGGKDGTRVQGR